MLYNHIKNVLTDIKTPPGSVTPCTIEQFKQLDSEILVSPPNSRKISDQYHKESGRLMVELTTLLPRMMASTKEVRAQAAICYINLALRLFLTITANEHWTEVMTTGQPK
eukprot:Awhi_evm1s10879